MPLLKRELVGKPVARPRLGFAGYLTLLIGVVHTPPEARHQQADVVLFISGAEWRILCSPISEVVMSWDRHDAEIESFLDSLPALTISRVVLGPRSKLEIGLGDYWIEAIPKPPFENDWTIFLGDESIVCPDSSGTPALLPAGS